MRVRYDVEADVLFVGVSDDAPVDAEEHSGGVIVSYGEDGDPVSVEFLNASKRGLIEPDGLNVLLQRDEASA